MRDEYLNGNPDTERMIEDSLISSTKRFEEFKSKSRLFALVPVESRLDIRLDRALGFDRVSLHLDLRASRSITSKAGWEEDGSWRYRRKRSSASSR